MVKRSLYIILINFFVIFSQEAEGQNASIYEVSRMSFSSGSFSDISPVILNDGILFCSDRRFSSLKDRTAWDGNRLYNIYLATKKDSASWRKPSELKSSRSSHFNNGPLSVAPDGKTVYFTSETETGKAAKKRDFKNRSGIFIADLSGTSLTNLRPFKYNNAAYNVGQPSVSSDGKYLFFASDMSGGQGRSDLYYCEFINGDWNTPVSLGPKVNSSGIENYPYMHPSGKLYFTSSRPGGLGGLDVYFTSLYNGNWEDPVSLSEPINSPSDDFAFTAAEDMQTGYFSSNRGKTDDIFRFASTVIRKASCDTLIENNFCYRFVEENALKVDTVPFRYEWKFGDGESASGRSVDHCYKGPGTYLVRLDIVNLITKEVLENEKTDTLVLTYAEQPYISAPDRVIAGESIKLNADSTNLPGWKISQYYWNFGDESIDLGKEVGKKYMKPGRFNIQLIVTAEPEPGGIVREACISKNIIVIQLP